MASTRSNELRAVSGAVAADLAERGLGAGARIGVMATRSRDTVAAFVGVLRAGAVYVPLDPDAPGERLAALMAAADVRLVVGERTTTTGVVAHATVTELASGTEFAIGTGESVGPADPAYIIFTSGSTGTPRPVLVSRAAPRTWRRRWSKRCMPAPRRTCGLLSTHR